MRRYTPARIFSAIVALFTPRSRGWRPLARRHLLLEPECQWCGGRTKLQVHHEIPVHTDPSKELDPNNLITLCMTRQYECHYRRGHRGKSWLDYDPDIRKKCNLRKRKARQ